MKRLYILGAGASASSQCGEVRCPTTTEFFICAFKLGLFDRYNKQDMMRPLFDYIRREFGIKKADLKHSHLNIEEVMTHIDNSIQDFFEHQQYRIYGQKRRGKRRFTTLSVRFQAVSFIGHVLLEITNNRLCTLHQRLANNLSDGDTVISFNYDLLMDTALMSTRRWSPNLGYGLQFKAIISNGKYLPAQPGNPPKITLLKLHGSLNWLYGVSAWSTIYGYSIPNGQDIFLLREINHEVLAKPIDIAGKYEHTENKIPYDLFSLIVAPLANKPYELLPKSTNQPWHRANKEIQLADEIVIIGYSIPESDLRSHDLIKAATMGSRHPEFVIVDSNPVPVIQRLQSLLGYEPSRVYTSFEEYLKLPNQ